MTPRWTTPNRIVYEDNAIIVRCFRSGIENPYLILPPQAGHHSVIADYGDKQSLVQLLLKTSNKGVFSIEWKSCTFERRYERITNLITQTDIAVLATGAETVQLIGLCQGGWVATIYAGVFPSHVNKIIIAAAPIDCQAGNGKIKALCNVTPMWFYHALVASGGGLMRGENMLRGFKMLNWYDRYVGDYVNFYLHCNDAKFMARHKKFKAWYEYTQDIAGKWYLEAVYHLFKQNELIRGKFLIDGVPVLLSGIECDLVLIAAENDDITTKEQVFNMAKYVSSKNILELLIPNCGHIGCFIKTKALEKEWVRAIQY